MLTDRTVPVEFEPMGMSREERERVEFLAAIVKRMRRQRDAAIDELERARIKSFLLGVLFASLFCGWLYAMNLPPG